MKYYMEDFTDLKGYKFLFDYLKLLPKKIIVKNIPYLFDIRAEGKSKLNSSHMKIYIKSLFK